MGRDAEPYSCAEKDSRNCALRKIRQTARRLSLCGRGSAPCSYNHGAKVDIEWIDSETITDGTAEEVLSSCNGILIPGGFGNRGIEGKITAAKYAREHNIPYLGICLGMQIAVIEYARHVCGLKGANSGEFDEQTDYKVIDFMPDKTKTLQKGEP